MDIYKTADSIEQLANDLPIQAAAAAVAQMQPWDAAKVLDAIDIINAGAILAVMDPAKAASIMSHASSEWIEIIFADMGEPWEQAIRALLSDS